MAGLHVDVPLDFSKASLAQDALQFWCINLLKLFK